MNLTKLWQTAFICCFCIATYSCDSTDPYKDAPQTVRLLGLEASINIDLSARKDWQLLVYNHPYAFEIDGNKLSATPQNPSNPYAFEVTANNKNGHAIMTFISRDYFKTRATGSLPANIKDQSTPEKFLSCDVLRGDYSGTAMENISFSLFHENALLMFKTVDLPADAEVYIHEEHHRQMITPLRDAEDPDSYKALVFPGNYLYTLHVIVKTGGKEYEKRLKPVHETRMDIPYPRGIGHSAIITFNVSVDENDKLQINDLEEKKFTKDWPAIP
ncbi:hypothetical protein [Bacteroides sp. 51]|uniref:hypothetical protein n=1 Tax=Bacteroides sp. 51 TaxID=2302938 RepID=UPI0013D1297F|nr:hypothetical protein [Bacteroides sp. 51]NDV84095.1 hypothetical protein [Bacteroides sp. 51]